MLNPIKSVNGNMVITSEAKRRNRLSLRQRFIPSFIIGTELYFKFY